ncbi:MAG: MMPL family transporter [Thermoleophilia bacterium]
MMLPAKIALFSFRKRWLVLLIWVALLTGMITWSQTLGSSFATDFTLPESDSQAALNLLQERFPERSGVTGDLVFKSVADIRDPVVQEAVMGVIDQISQVPHVAAVVSPYTQEGAPQISPNGHIARAVIQFDGDNQEIQSDKATIDAIKGIVASERAEGIQFELGGQLFGGHPKIGAEGIGLMAAIIILLIAFGSVLAMGLPIITALFGIGIGVSSVTLMSHVISLPDFTIQLASMIGIGAAMVVAVTMLASITLLPAVLGFVGERIDKYKIPGTGRKKQAEKQGIWYRWGRVLERHSWPAFLIGLAMIVLLALPVFSIRLGFSDASALPTSDTTRRAYDLEAEGFGPGSNGPLSLADQINGPADCGRGFCPMPRLAAA